MSEISEIVQGFHTDAVITLFQLDTTKLGGDIYYFTNTSKDGQPIVFDGESYTAMDIKAEGFEWSGVGAAPTPRLRIDNPNDIARGLIIEFNDLVGATLTRIRTHERFLDNGSEPDPIATYPSDQFTIERKSSLTKDSVTWELSSILDQEGVMLPGRQVLRNICQQRYRMYTTGGFNYSQATCPYTGTGYWDEENQPTDAQHDACSKTLGGCRLRFGANGELPTWAFPGVARVRM